jgi:hypothetical protein
LPWAAVASCHAAFHLKTRGDVEPTVGYAAAIPSISISSSSENNRETSTSVMAGAAGGFTVLKKRSRARLQSANLSLSRMKTVSLTRCRASQPTLCMQCDDVGAICQSQARLQCLLLDLQVVKAVAHTL